MPAPKPSIPDQHRANFRHLYLDIGWFGLLNGSAMSFISVYLVRIGASAFEIGLMNASPAVMAILLAIPAGAWLKNQHLDRAVFWTSVLNRAFYALWIPLPALFLHSTQVWLVIGITLLMSVPGAALAVGFNAMFADAVPPEWRGHVVGVRNAVLAGTFIATSLLCGYLLDNVIFPLNYQIVFALGVVGAVMSSYHLHRIRLGSVIPERVGRSLGDLVQPGFGQGLGDALRTGVGLRFLTRRFGLRKPRFSVLRGPFGPVLLSLFAFHLTQHLAIPLFPIYWVENLALTDQEISLGTALFYGMVFIGSTQLSRLTDRFGNRAITVAGAILMSTYPGLTALSRGVPLFMVTSVVGGMAWSLAGGAMSNYILEKIPQDEMPTHLAWYMVIANLAVLAGSLGGPALANWIGLIPALMLIAAGRVLSALGIWRWGKPDPSGGTDLPEGVAPPLG